MTMCAWAIVPTGLTIVTIVAAFAPAVSAVNMLNILHLHTMKTANMTLILTLFMVAHF